MAPSIHRAPVNQFLDIELEAGEHELLAGVAPLNGEESIFWNFGIGDVNSKQWLTNDMCNFNN